MKWIVDAQLPRRLAVLLQTLGHDTFHTLDLPKKNRTTDDEIATLANLDGRVVITKDADFVESFILSGKPRQLLLVSTGNCSNAVLMTLFEKNLARIAVEFLTSNFIELDLQRLTIHQ